MKTWTIKSTSDPSKQYQVTKVEEWDWQCTCPDFQMRHHDCKHIKGVQKAYDKQAAKSKPAPNRSKDAPVQSDDRGHGEKRNPVPSGELRRSSSLNGNDPGVHAGKEPSERGGRSDSSSSPETSVGTPSVEPMVSRPAEGSYQTPPASNSTVRSADEEREQLKIKREAQLKQYEAWQLRRTSHSSQLHDLWQELEKKKLEQPVRKSIIDMQIKPLLIGIKKYNRKDWQAKPDFDTSLIDVEPDEIDQETAETVANIQKTMF